MLLDPLAALQAIELFESGDSVPHLRSVIYDETGDTICDNLTHRTPASKR